MKRLVISSGIIMAACISLLAAGMNPTIYATGEGIVSVPADTATIIVSVSSSTGNMSRDQIAVQEMMTRVIDALKAAGVAEEEIMPGQSSGISSFQSSSKICRRINNSTICDNSSQQATALERSAVIKLNYTDEARIDNLLDAAESAGAEAYVAGYGLSDPSDAAARAREKAVANARANAADIAAAEGLRLGQVVDISDYGFPAAVYDGLSGSAQSGMVDVTSYVLVTYELEVWSQNIQFQKAPRGVSFGHEHTPFGPSATLERLEIDNSRWDRNLEKVYYDDDLLAAEAVAGLHEKVLPFSCIEKAFSTGSFGVGKRRPLVPTRWSIIAWDSILASRLRQKVRGHDPIDCYQAREFSSLNNYYAVLLVPTAWQYEWMEAFLHILGDEELIFSDYEHNCGKKGYSRVGGCYYSCKMAVLEALTREKKQAGAIIFREAYPGYVPLGVFNVRENVRNAMHQPGRDFEDIKAALHHISGRVELPVKRFILESDLLQEQLRSRQTTLSSFLQNEV